MNDFSTQGTKINVLMLDMVIQIINYLLIRNKNNKFSLISLGIHNNMFDFFKKHFLKLIFLGVSIHRLT